MYPASERFLAAVKHSHTKIHRLRVLNAGQVEYALDIEAGSHLGWSLDDVIRTRAQITAVDPTGELVPSEAEDLLDPFSARLSLERGIRFPDGTEELVPLGRVRPTSVSARWRDGLTVIDLECFDEFVTAQEPMERAFAVASGTPVHMTVARLLTEQVPTLSFRLTQTPFTTPPLLIAEDSDAVAEAVALARTAGCQLFIDRDIDEDVCTMSPRILDADHGQVVWEFVEGENADFMEPERNLTSEDVPNVIKVVGTHPALGSGGVSGEASDQDPASPTYVGRYRKRLTIRSDKVASGAHATTAAAGILSRVLGRADEVKVHIVPNPALTLGDVASTVCERLRLLGRPMIVTDIDPMPLDAEERATVTLRRSVATELDLALGDQ